MTRSTPYHAGRQMLEEELLAPSEACPACTYDGHREPTHQLQREPDVHLLSCPACGIASASRMPTQTALDAYYRAYYDPGAPKVTFGDRERFARHILSSAHAPAKRSTLALLDFGGGDGTLAIAVAERALRSNLCDRVEILEVEYEEPRATENPAIQIRRVPELSDADGSFDLILASAILEHVPEVGSTLRRLFSMAAPGALLYARTPYWVPLTRWVPSIDLTFPGHVHDMGAPFWNRVTQTYRVPAKLLRSRPSIVETTWRSDPLRTLAAHLLKPPGHLESRWRRPGWVQPWWGLVGGWEVVLRFESDPT